MSWTPTEGEAVRKTSKKTHPEPRFLYASLPTPGELAASTVDWERRGLLGRLVRRP
jgi:hypothetical protein